MALDLESDETALRAEMFPLPQLMIKVSLIKKSMVQIWAILKKHQMDACSCRLGEIMEAMMGPKRNRNRPWMIMPFFSYL